MTKNITLAVDADLLARFRVLAAERKTTVNALVRQHMAEAVGLEARRSAAIARMLELGNQSTAQIDMSKWDRESSYARGSKA
ncbi:hypothetical protein [Parerythrobacter lacustris]|uniref:Ribbon-helix-helix protein, CopG family n=1 Tax=Parerythrobacter lacustris TaxID=2969984 RepID=A0ABT1XT11_9SPHN|nr:hypothetical protein [Parerythrobacter lacustris]MCR2833582.1 hypothetical protein [Parerythrobacter lacustris]